MIFAVRSSPCRVSGSFCLIADPSLYIQIWDGIWTRPATRNRKREPVLEVRSESGSTSSECGSQEASEREEAENREERVTLTNYQISEEETYGTEIELMAFWRCALALVLVPPTASLTLPRYRSQALQKSLTTGAPSLPRRHTRDDRWTRGTDPSSKDEKRSGVAVHIYMIN